MGFICSLGELFSSVLVFITIRQNDCDTMLIVMEDRVRGNRIERMGDNFTKNFEIVFTILSGIIILCGTQESSYNVSFYFRKKIRYIPFNEIELTVKLRIKDN